MKTKILTALISTLVLFAATAGGPLRNRYEIAIMRFCPETLDVVFENGNYDLLGMWDGKSKDVELELWDRISYDIWPAQVKNMEVALVWVYDTWSRRQYYLPITMPEGTCLMSWQICLDSQGAVVLYPCWF